MSNSDMRINEVGRRAQENGNLIWNAANSLFGAFKPHEYGLVILPMCVIKRFHDCLIPTYAAVLEANKEFGELGELKVGFLKEASGYQFYNISRFTFASLITDHHQVRIPFCTKYGGHADHHPQVEGARCGGVF